MIPGIWIVSWALVHAIIQILMLPKGEAYRSRFVLYLFCPLACWDPENSVRRGGGGPDNLFQSSMFFTEGGMDLPGEATVDPQGDPYQYFYGYLYQLVIFQGWPGTPCPPSPLDPPMSCLVCSNSQQLLN